ncbi:MAG: rhombotarget lipoprotein [Steroidobacteraceae bacterium]
MTSATARKCMLGLLPLVLAGCQSLDAMCLLNCGKSHATSTTLVEFLYPDGDVPQPGESPALRVPLRVGLTFLPPASPAGADIAVQREMLLQRIKERFIGLDYVSDIVVIPDYYLRAGAVAGNFETLQRIAHLQDLDVVALASYDQVSQRDENRRALSYLTIVGAFLVRGNRNETGTLIDLAVIEPQTRTLLLRAGGTSMLVGSTTMIEQGVTLRNQQVEGFNLALADLNNHFATELATFEERVRQGTAPIRVVKRSGFGIGAVGAVDGLFTLSLALVVLFARSSSAQRVRREFRRLTVHRRSAGRHQ